VGTDQAISKELIECEIPDDFVEDINKTHALVFADGVVRVSEKTSIEFRLNKSKFYTKYDYHITVQLPDGSPRTVPWFTVWKGNPNRRVIKYASPFYDASLNLPRAENKERWARKKFELTDNLLYIADDIDCEKELRQREIYEKKWHKAHDELKELRSAKYFFGF
jgi:hypothetical protein